jgi:hypothetical protein
MIAWWRGRLLGRCFLISGPEPQPTWSMSAGWAAMRRTSGLAGSCCAFLPGTKADLTGMTGVQP